MSQLIANEDYDDLPEDNDSCFAEFEYRVRNKMNRMFDDDGRSSNMFVQSIRLQYMACVYSVAVECGITSLPMPRMFSDDSEFYNFYIHFELAVQGEVARIRVRGRRPRNSDSVLLIGNTKAKIQNQVSRLRQVIEKSDLPIPKQQKLNAKLDELLAEIERPRLSFGKVMVVLTSVAAGLSPIANATIIAAEGPKAITTIMRLIGVDKESEDAAILRLTPPQQALPAPSDGTDSAFPEGRPQSNVPLDSEEDIPF